MINYHLCTICGKEYPCTVSSCNHPYAFGYCSKECVTKMIENKKPDNNEILKAPTIDKSQSNELTQEQMQFAIRKKWREDKSAYRANCSIDKNSTLKPLKEMGAIDMRLLAVNLLKMAKNNHKFTYQYLSLHTGIDQATLSGYARGHVLPNQDRAKKITEIVTKLIPEIQTTKTMIVKQETVLPENMQPLELPSPPVASEDTARIKLEAVELLRKAKNNHKIKFGDIAKKVGTSASLLSRYVGGTSLPNRNRAQLIVDTIKEMIPSTTIVPQVKEENKQQQEIVMPIIEDSEIKVQSEEPPKRGVEAKFTKFYGHLIDGNAVALSKYLANIMSDGGQVERERYDYRINMLKRTFPELYTEHFNNVLNRIAVCKSSSEEAVNSLQTFRAIVNLAYDYRTNAKEFYYIIDDMKSKIKPLMEQNLSDDEIAEQLNYNPYLIVYLKNKIKESLSFNLKPVNTLLRDGMKESLPSEFQSFIRKPSMNNTGGFNVSIPKSIIDDAKLKGEYLLIAVKKASKEEVREYICNQINDDTMDAILNSIKKDGATMK